MFMPHLALFMRSKPPSTASALPSEPLASSVHAIVGRPTMALGGITEAASVPQASGRPCQAAANPRRCPRSNSSLHQAAAPYMRSRGWSSCLSALRPLARARRPARGRAATRQACRVPVLRRPACMGTLPHAPSHDTHVLLDMLGPATAAAGRALCRPRRPAHAQQQVGRAGQQRRGGQAARGRRARERAAHLGRRRGRVRCQVHSAAAPATCGTAMLVPDAQAYAASLSSAQRPARSAQPGALWRTGPKPCSRSRSAARPRQPPLAAGMHAVHRAGRTPAGVVQGGRRCGRRCEPSREPDGRRNENGRARAPPHADAISVPGAKRATHAPELVYCGAACGSGSFCRPKPCGAAQPGRRAPPEHMLRGLASHAAMPCIECSSALYGEQRPHKTCCTLQRHTAPMVGPRAG